MRGRKPDKIITASDRPASAPSAPSWMAKDARAEWRRVMPYLWSKGIVSSPDYGSVENYCVITGRIRELDRSIQEAKAGIDPKLMRLQAMLVQTARQLAAELGLTPVSRSRPVMREGAEDDLEFLG